MQHVSILELFHLILSKVQIPNGFRNQTFGYQLTLKIKEGKKKKWSCC